MTEGEQSFFTSSAEGESRENDPISNMEKFGIGHMEDGATFSLDEMPARERESLLEDYEECVADIGNLMSEISGQLERLEVDENKKDITDDLKSGIEKSLFKTANQILYHSKENAQQSSDAFDELNMLLKISSQSLREPKILEKQKKIEGPMFHLDTSFKGLEYRSADTVNAFFSKRTIAWNVTSHSNHDAKGTTKSGIRLDYGPLYKETDGEIDKKKTEWVTSVDISGHHIDKVMNRYSLRGHHHPKMFEYKVGLLIPGLSEAMEKHYDDFVSESDE